MQHKRRNICITKIVFVYICYFCEVFILVLGVEVLTSCTPPGISAMYSAPSVPFRVISHNSNSKNIKDPLLFVARSATESVPAEFSGIFIPQIDYSKEIAVMLLMPTDPYNGHIIDITSIAETSTSLNLHAIYWKPLKGVDLTLMIGAPEVTIAIPLSSKEVKISEIATYPIQYRNKDFVGR